MLLGRVHGGRLLLFSLKTGQNVPDLLFGDVAGVSGGQHLAGGILCICRNSKGHGGQIDLGKTDQKLNQTRRLIEADREYPLGFGVQSADVARFFDLERPFDGLHHKKGGGAHGFVQIQDIIHGSSRR